METPSESILDIKGTKNNNTSLIKVLLVFYLIIASNFTGGLMGKQMREYMEKNRFIQHIVGFITMIVVVTLIGGIVDTHKAVVYALIGYTWFIFTTKLDIHWNLIILTLLFVGYMYENSKKLSEVHVVDDKNLPNDVKEQIIQQDTNYNTYFACVIILITVIGTLLYSDKKYQQYGSGYDPVKYVFY